MNRSWNIRLALLASLAWAMVEPASAQQQQQKPNILVIMGDDIGYWNISAYNRGMMGYRTPNIDRVAAEGIRFTDSYGEQSCTAGRSAFITGQSVYRTGLSKVGIPSSPVGLSGDDPTIAERLKFLQKSLGAVPGPFDCWLVLRGLRTLALRMERHCENARAVAAFLSEHAAVDRVLYPGLPGHPGHEIAAAQMRDFGGMISFFARSEEEAEALVTRTKVWTLAESLGGVESLIEVPARMTHASTSEASFATPGNLIRLSVGLESAADLVADLEQALAGSAPQAGARERTAS